MCNKYYLLFLSDDRRISDKKDEIRTQKTVIQCGAKAMVFSIYQLMFYLRIYQYTKTHDQIARKQPLQIQVPISKQNVMVTKVLIISNVANICIVYSIAALYYFIHFISTSVSTVHLKLKL